MVIHTGGFFRIKAYLSERCCKVAEKNITANFRGRGYNWTIGLNVTGLKGNHLSLQACGLNVKISQA